MSAVASKALILQKKHSLKKISTAASSVENGELIYYFLKGLM